MEGFFVMSLGGLYLGFIFSILRYIIFQTHGTFIDLANPTFFLVCITVLTDFCNFSLLMYVLVLS